MNSKDLKLLKSKLDIKSLIKKIDAEVKNINTRSDLGERTLSWLVYDNVNAVEGEFQDYEKLLEEMWEWEDKGTLLSKISDNFKIVNNFSESTLPTVFTFTVIESKINNRWYLIVNDNDGVNPKVGIGLSSDSSSEILDELNKTVTKLIPDRSSSGRH